MRLCSGKKTPPGNICRLKSTNQSSERNGRLHNLCFSICRCSQVVFIPRAQPYTQSLFLFPIVFGINLIHFSMRRTVQPEIRSFFFFPVLRSPVTPFDSSKTKNANCFEECNVFGNGKCKLSAIQEGRNRCKYLSRKSAKPFANFSATKVTSLPSLSLSVSLSLSLSLCLSLSLSLSLSHRAHLTCNIGSASALPIAHKGKTLQNSNILSCRPFFQTFFEILSDLNRAVPNHLADESQTR